LSGGPSSYRISEPIVPEVEEYVSRLMRSLSWSGIAMIEFKRDCKTRALYLLEINGRFWGSLPLAVAAGADFPYYLYEFMVSQRRNFPRTYKTEKRCRNIEKELEWLKTVLFRKKTENPIIKYPTYSRILIDTFRFLNPTECSDTFSFTDPMPGFQDIYNIWGSLVAFAKKRIIYMRELRRMKKIKKDPKTLFEKVDQIKKILFVCTGNVIRSPFAARYLEQALDRNRESIFIDSAGLDTVSGRNAHPNMIKKAKEIGLNVKSHRAVLISDAMVRKADIILVMEIKHLVMMNQRYPDSMEKTFLLGCFSEDNLMEVPDPDLEKDVIFETCFTQIMNSVKVLALRLNGNLGTI
jgi:protein-tyrosine-phosphatase